MKKIFSKEEVIDIIENLLQMPDILTDAIQNEYTDYDAETLLTLASNKATLTS